MAATVATLGYVLVLVATLAGLPGLGRVPLPGVAELRTPAPAPRGAVGDRPVVEDLPDLDPPAAPSPSRSATTTSATATSSTSVAPSPPSTSATVPPTVSPTVGPSTTTTGPPGRGTTTTVDRPGRASTTTGPPGRGSTTTSAPTDSTTPGSGRGFPPGTGGSP